MAPPPDMDWIEPRLTGARPRALAALTRYFRDLDLAEEALQEACLRALKAWPTQGPPRDPAAWLIMVGRNVALDQVRRQRKQTDLPKDETWEEGRLLAGDMADRLDESEYRDDILRLLFVCCHPELPATQQIALALRVVSGLPVSRIAAMFLVAERTMEQRIVRAKARIAQTDVPFEAPGAAARAERFSAVATMIYLIFNEAYTCADRESERASLGNEAIRLARLLLRLFPGEPEMMGLLALMMLQHARRRARFDAAGAPILLDEQDRSLWHKGQIDEALAMLDKAMRHRRPGPYQIQAAIAALHVRAARAEDTDWQGIEDLYQALERHTPSPVVTLNRAVAVWKVRGAEAALEMIASLEQSLENYFYFHGTRGALLRQLGRTVEAREAFSRAIGLANTAAEAAHIRQHLDALDREHHKATSGLP